MLEAAEVLGFVFRPVMSGVAGDRAPKEMAGAAPVIEEDSLLERLAACGHDDDIVLDVGSRIGFGPMKLDRAKPKGIEPKKEFVREMITVSVFSGTDVNEETLHVSGRRHIPFGGELPAGVVSGLGHAAGFIGADAGTHLGDARDERGVVRTGGETQLAGRKLRGGDRAKAKGDRCRPRRFYSRTPHASLIRTGNETSPVRKIAPEQNRVAAAILY